MLNDLIVYTPMYVTFFWAVVLLLTHRQKNPAKHFLGIFMLVAFVLYLCHSIFFNNYYTLYFYVEPVYLTASLSVYPLYFWYIKLLTAETKTYFYNLLMFVPALFIGLTAGAVSLLMSPDEKEIYIQQLQMAVQVNGPKPILIQIQKWVFLAGRVVFAAQVIFFLVYGSKLVLKYNYRIANFYSNLESKTIVWVNFLLFSFVATSIMSVVFNIIGKTVFSENIWLLLIPSAIFSILLFIIGLQGYMQNHTIRDLEKDELQSQPGEVKNQNQKILLEKLINLFEKEKVYKQTDLKITHISTVLHSNRTYISNLINKEFSCTFSDFVNSYRLEEAKNLLLDDMARIYSLDYISEKSGFGSQSTFIRVFKENEGITPGKFRDKNSFESTTDKIL